MEDNFNIFIFTEDADFSASLAIECNNYGFALTFIDNESIKLNLVDDDALISVVIIDLTSSVGNPYEIGEKAKICSDFPIFGVVDRFNKKDQVKAKEYGFDLFNLSCLINL